eukprot:5753883-Pleurochrysis_carterae.AAC.1
MGPTIYALITEVLEQEELSVLEEMRDYLLSMRDYEKCWLLNTAITVAPFRVLDLLRCFRLHIDQYPDDFTHELATALKRTHLHELDSVYDLIQTCVQAPLIEEAMTNMVLGFNNLHSKEAFDVRVCMCLHSAKPHDYFLTKDDNFRSFCVSVCALGLNGALSVLIELYHLSAFDATRYDLAMECATATSGSFA